VRFEDGLVQAAKEAGYNKVRIDFNPMAGAIFLELDLTAGDGMAGASQ
jgi:molecular chaperone DnaK (HSP70)